MVIYRIFSQKKQNFWQTIVSRGTSVIEYKYAFSLFTSSDVGAFIIIKGSMHGDFVCFIQQLCSEYFYNILNKFCKDISSVLLLLVYCVFMDIITKMILSWLGHHIACILAFKSTGQYNKPY